LNLFDQTKGIYKNELNFYTKAYFMDQPKTRRESKKDQKEKGGGKYSTKHVRMTQAIRERQKS
jgi:hypothetical protein